jgi:hypothetical protein
MSLRTSRCQMHLQRHHIIQMRVWKEPRAGKLPGSKKKFRQPVLLGRQLAVWQGHNVHYVREVYAFGGFASEDALEHQRRLMIRRRVLAIVNMSHLQSGLSPDYGGMYKIDIRMPFFPFFPLPLAEICTHTRLFREPRRGTKECCSEAALHVNEPDFRGRGRWKQGQWGPYRLESKTTGDPGFYWW